MTVHHTVISVTVTAAGRHLHAGRRRRAGAAARGQAHDRHPPGIGSILKTKNLDPLAGRHLHAGRRRAAGAAARGQAHD